MNVFAGLLLICNIRSHYNGNHMFIKDVPVSVLYTDERRVLIEYNIAKSPGVVYYGDTDNDFVYISDMFNKDGMNCRKR
jgi:hypothetical protein